MTAPVPIQRGREIRARNIALAKAERVRELAEEIASAADTPEGRVFLGAEYERMGWANRDEIRMALEALGEA
jgi:hypothetical protein